MYKEMKMELSPEIKYKVFKKGYQQWRDSLANLSNGEITSEEQFLLNKVNDVIHKILENVIQRESSRITKGK